MSSSSISPSSSSSSKSERIPLLAAKDDEEMGDDHHHLVTSSTSRRNRHINMLIQYGTMLAIGSLCLLVSIICVLQSTAQQHHVHKDISSLKYQGGTAMPHFVFILADDLGWNAIGYRDYDMSFTTPTLTQMAGDGIILSQYYSMEMCTPARGALLTGRYPLTIGMQYGVVSTDRPWGLDLSEQLLASALSNEGYKTHIVGKWHLGHHSPRYLPTARGFDTFTGYLGTITIIPNEILSILYLLIFWKRIQLVILLTYVKICTIIPPIFMDIVPYKLSMNMIKANHYFCIYPFKQSMIRFKMW